MDWVFRIGILLVGIGAVIGHSIGNSEFYNRSDIGLLFLEYGPTNVRDFPFIIIGIGALMIVISVISFKRSKTIQ